MTGSVFPPSFPGLLMRQHLSACLQLPSDSSEAAAFMSQNSPFYLRVSPAGAYFSNYSVRFYCSKEFVQQVAFYFLLEVPF